MQRYIYNDITIDAYNEQFEQYLLNTPHGYNNGHDFFLWWIDHSLSFVSSKGNILEIGSGHGRDARYICSKGFSVLRTDAAQASVDYLNQKNEPAKRFNILRHSINGYYNMVYADGVVPHFKPEDLALVLRKVYMHLEPGGVFSFNAKQGQGEAWINEKGILRRYTHYWDPEALRDIICRHGFVLELFQDSVIGGDVPSQLWIHVIARKPSA